MKKLYYLLALPLFFFLSSCEKDQEAEAVPKPTSEISEADYHAFLKQTTPQFIGTINGKAFSWRYGEYSLNMGRCAYEPLREVYFGLAQNKNYFRFYLPYYNFREEADFNRVFAPGKKKMGDLANDFYLEMTVNGQSYVTNSSLKIKELEIIKTEEYTLEGNQGQDGEFIPYSEKRMRIWIKVNAQLATCSSCTGAAPVPVTGLMLAEVYDYQGEI